MQYLQYLDSTFITINGVYKIPSGTCVFRSKYSGRSMYSLKQCPGQQGFTSILCQTEPVLYAFEIRV